MQSQAQKPDSDTYEIDTNSLVHWTGRNIANAHDGKVKIQKGSITIKDNKLVSGSITLDMNTISNSDLDDSELNKGLVDHLKSSDFFEVDKYPTATIDIVSVKPIDDVNSKPTHVIDAKLPLKQITHPISFAAFIQKRDTWVIAAHFDIDRTRWNVQYGSEKFFAKLGMHIIEDLISFDERISTKAE